MATFTESFDGSLDLTWDIVRGTESLTVNADDTGSIDTGTDEWGFVRADGDTESADMFAEVTVAQDFDDSDRQALLLVRAQSDTSQTYYAAVLNQDAGWCTVLRYDDGAATPLGTPDEAVTIPSAPFTFRLEAEGDTLTVLLDGSSVKSETDDQITGTRGGLGVRTGGTTVRFDDYSTGALSDGEDPPPASDAEVNLSPNPAAGANADGWNDGPYAASTGERVTGLSGFSRDTGFELTASGYTETPVVEVEQDVEYTFQCEIRTPSDETGVAIWLDWFDTADSPADGDLVSADEESFDFTADEVHTVSFTGTAPAGAVSCIFATNSLPSGTVFTAHMASPEDGPQEYADGESTDWAWDGDRYNSTSRLDEGMGEPEDLTVIATTSAGSDVQSTIEVDTPAGLQDGDVLLGVHFYTYNATQDHGPASGFTEDYFDDSVSGSDDTSPVLVVYSHEVTAAGSEPSSYTFDAASDGNNVIFLVAVRGADASDLYADGLQAEGTPNSTGHEIPGRTLSEDGSLYLGFFGSQAFTEDADTNWSAPPEMTEAGQFSQVFNNGLVAYELRDSGSVGAREATVSASESAGKVGSLALRAGTDSGEPPPDTAAERYGWGTPLPASDEFDYTGPPDPDKWGVYDSEGHDGNGVRDPAQVTVQDGYLRIEGTEDGASGALAQQFDQQYGRWECRARFASTDPAGESYHPVLIVWPESEEWPEDGEYDWVEIEDVDTDQIQAYLHYPHDDGPIEQEYVTGPSGIDFTEWHNFAFEWVEGSLRGFLDGEEWFSLDGSMTSSNGRRLDSMPSGHLTMQLDNFTGSSGLQPAYFDVEWARVYSAEGSSEVRSGTGTAPAELGATGTGSKTAEGTGSAPAALAVSGTTDGRTADGGTGSTRAALGASGRTAGRTATATGTARLALTAAGTGTRDADASGTAGHTLGATGTGTAERTGTGTAPAGLAAAGSGSKEADTAGDVPPARLDTDGIATGVPIDTRTGTAAATLDATGTGRKVATATGTARLALATAGSGSKTTDGAGTVPGLALQEAADSDRSADVTGQAPAARLATAGSTDGRTADRVTGTAPAYLSAGGTVTRETDAHGSVSALLRTAGTGAGLRAAEGSAGPLAVTAAGTGRREADATGTARLAFRADGIASGSGGVAIRYGTADPLGLAASGTGWKVATTTGRASGLVLAAGAAPLRPGRVSVTSEGRGPVSITERGMGLRVTERGTGLRVRAANA